MPRDAFLPLMEAYVRAWHGIDPPNAPARRMAASLAAMAEAFARLRTEPRLEDAPSDFAATLRALRDPQE